MCYGGDLLYNGEDFPYKGEDFVHYGADCCAMGETFVLRGRVLVLLIRFLFCWDTGMSLDVFGMCSGGHLVDICSLFLL